MCIEEAHAAEDRNAERIDAVADASAACLAVTVCTLDSLDEGEGDGDGDGDDWSDPEPEPNDDWGEDWGEQSPSEALELSSPVELRDLPEDELSASEGRRY